MNVVDSSAWLEFFADGPNASVFSEPLEIYLPRTFRFHSVFESVGFLAPPIGDGLKFFDPE